MVQSRKVFLEIKVSRKLDLFSKFIGDLFDLDSVAY